MNYSMMDAAGLVGIVGVVLEQACNTTKPDGCRKSCSHAKKFPVNPKGSPDSIDRGTKRVLVIERDKTRLGALRSILEGSAPALDLRVVASEHDALDFLNMSARFSPERLPDVVIIGAGVAKHNNSYNIMRFINNDDRYDRLRVFAFTTSTADREAAMHEDPQPFRQVHQLWSDEPEAALFGTAS